ncbi:MAG: aspartate aminotransferase family protein [Phycisphaerae bacterium]
MITSEVVDQFEKYVIGNYNRLPVVIVKGEGSRMWDLDGKEYLDMFPGWAVSGLGHCHPKVTQALQKQAAELIHIDNTFYNIPQGRLAQLLSERSFGGKCFFCNSGAEANEAAIKLARLAGEEKRYKIITMERSFHGRTFAAMTATGQAKTHAGFQPLLPGFSYVPFNDFGAVERAVDDETIAIMLEPVQGEGGVNIADREYMNSLRKLCDERKMLLIFDEVQTGMGRTGKWFGYQHYDVVPDIITLAKALGGGTSIGAIVAKPEVAKFMVPGKHASTFGGNPLACAAGIAVIEAIEEGNLLDHTNKMGQYIREKFETMKEKHRLIKDIRQLGLMIGVELAVAGDQIVSIALQKGLRINCTQQTVLRLTPAMVVTTDQIHHAFAILDEVFGEYEESLAQGSGEQAHAKH